MTAADRRIARRRKDIRAQDNRYRLAGRSVRLERDEGLVAVRFRDHIPRDEWAQAVETVDGLLPFETRREVPGERLTLLAVTPRELGGAGAMAAKAALGARPEVARAFPVFRVGDARAIPTGRALIRFRPGTAIRDILKAHDLAALEQREGMVIAGAPDEADVFQTCRQLHGQREVLGAEPDFAVFSPAVPAGCGLHHGEAWGREQYALRLVRAPEAQAVVAGHPGIRVAVLDDGIDAGHPDLAGAVVGRFDALRAARSPWNWHGTACAGLIAGRGAVGEGIRGVAAGCSLLDVRVRRAEGAGAAWMSGIAAICRGIEWSWREAGAAVILLGWAEALESPEIREAIEEARTRGRGGRGCVIVAAAGDQPGPVAYPGCLPNLLTVAASNAFDEAKSPWTRDAETGWGSAHGPQVGLMAPGVQMLTAGSGPGRRACFGGTAAAAAIVAGACALVLSLRPRMAEAELRELLGMTADPVGQYRYAEGRNDYCGPGRVNVLEAVEAARALL